MKLPRILLVATGAEFSFASAIAGGLGLLGFWSGLLDGINHFAPLVLGAGLVGGALAWFAAPKSASRGLVLAAALFGVAAPLAQMAPDLSVAALGLLNRTPPGPASLRVLHFNVWAENFDPRRTADAIIASGADVVLMQEGAGTLSPQFRRIRAAYPYMAACERVWVCGQVIWSKRPIEAWGALEPHPPLKSDALGVVWARIRAPDGRPAVFATTHFSWPIPSRPQAVQRAKLARYIATLPKDDMILSGDLNSTPWSFGLRRLDDGLKPLSRRTRAFFSWPANVARMERAFPIPLMPIDQIYAGPRWRTVELKPLPRLGSDHYAVMATFTR